jgi:hypothetical protein
MTSESAPKPTKTVGTIKTDKSTLGERDPVALKAAIAFTRMVARKLGVAPGVLEEGLVLGRKALDAGKGLEGEDREAAELKVLGGGAYDDLYVKLRAVSTFFPPAAAKDDLGPARQKLAQSLNEAWGVYHDSPDRGRRGVHIALMAAGEFVKAAADPQSAKMFYQFLVVLTAALRDRDDAVTAPLFKQGIETDSSAYRNIQRHAVATMAGIMDVGYSREEAAKEVTAALTKNGFPAKKRAVKKWYDERLPVEVKPRKGRPPKSAPGPQSEDALFHYLILNKVFPNCGPEQHAKFLLDELIYVTRLWFPAPGKGTR